MKTAVITGSTGGIGSEISKLLSAQGWNLILVNRAGDAATEQKSFLSKTYPKQRFTNYSANFMEVSEVEKVIEEIRSTESDITGLYNVAGILTDQRLMSSKGHEAHFAINTLAPYLFIKGLQANLKKKSSNGDASIIINFSTSAVHSVKNLDISSLPNPKSIGGLMGAYAKSKLALDILTCSLKSNLLEDGVLIESVDPGATKTRMTKDNRAMPWIIRLLRPLLFKTPEERASQIIAAVDSCIKEHKTGLYISEGQFKSMPTIADNKTLQTELNELLKSVSSAQTYFSP